jgi:nicotinamidase-related amidase
MSLKNSLQLLKWNKGLKFMKKTALIVIDIQNDYFPGGKFELEGAESSAIQAAKAIAEFRA